MVHPQWYEVAAWHPYISLMRLTGDVEFLDVWHEAYAAIMRYSRGSDGFWVDLFPLFTLKYPLTYNSFAALIFIREMWHTAHRILSPHFGQVFRFWEEM